MKKLQQLLSLALVATTVLVAGCSSDEPGGEKGSTPSPLYRIPASQQQRQTIDRVNETAVDMWNVIVSQGDNVDLLFSPLNIQMTFSMLANGIDDQKALDELTSLYVSDKDENALANLNELNRFLLAELPKVDKSVKMNIANAVWYSDEEKLNAQFESVVKEYYSAPGYAFTVGTEKAKNAMNKWVSENTDGFIKVMAPGPPANDLVAANATYFKATWADKFDPSMTRKEKFTKAGGEVVMVDMMHNQEIKTVYAETDDFLAFNLGYGNGGYAMTVILPNEGKNISDCDIRDVVTSNPKASCNLTIAMPKFETSAMSGPFDILERMGRTAIYGGIKNSTRIFDGNSPKMFETGQIARIKVDESGTEAAAATSVFIDYTPQVSLDVKVNRPFIYVIRENSTGAVLFIGSKSSF